LRGDGIRRRRGRTGWWISWTDAEGRHQIKSKYEDFDLARHELEALRSAAKSPSQITFGQYATRWMASQRAYLGELTTQGRLVARRRHSRMKTVRLSPNTRKNIFIVLSSMYSRAVEDELLTFNPALKLGLQRRGQGRKAEFLTREEAERFLEASRELRPRRYPFFLAALRTGMRLGELAALQWGDVQFGESESDPNRHIIVRHNFTHGHFTDPKSRKERRVDLNRELRSVLVELRDGIELQAMQCGEEVSELVFPSSTGGPIDRANLYHRDFLPCLTAAGLRRINLHALRHSFASMLLASGASLMYVSEQMGHSSIQVTVDTYGHLVPGRNIEWMDGLSLNSKQPESNPEASRRARAEVRNPASH